MRPRRAALLLLCLSFLLAACLGCGAAPWAAGDKAYDWDYIQVGLAVQANGDLEVTEVHRYVFRGGPFTYAFRSIPLYRIESIDDVWVEEGGHRYGVGEMRAGQHDDSFEIRWSFPPTTDAARTFTLHYRAHGALRIYEGGDQLWWKAIFSERPSPVRSAWVTVFLPAPVDPAALRVATYGTPAEWELAGQQAVAFTSGEVAPGRELEVRVQFPHGLVSASPPAWQAAADRQAAYDANVRPRVNLLLGALSLYLLVAGGLGLLLLWYARGRDPRAASPTLYTGGPPSDLAPGLARILLVGRADQRALVATIVDLARRGLLELHEQYDAGPLTPGGRPDFTLRLLREDPSLPPYEAETLRWLFGGLRERRLSDAGRYSDAIEEIGELMSAEMVRAGYYPASPEETRQSYLYWGLALAFVGLAGAALGFGVLRWYPDSVVRLIGVAVQAWLQRYTDVAPWPCLAMAALGGLAAVVGGYMPRRTALGAREEARWRGFRRYLAQVEKHTDLAQAREIFDRYLPYAIAFGLDRDWVAKFAVVGAPAPGWYVPYPPALLGGAIVPAAGAGMLAGLAAPALQGMSDGLAASLQSMSDGLVSTLNAGASSGPDGLGDGSGGGGWSGGGGSGGGGGGGGAGGAG